MVIDLSKITGKDLNGQYHAIRQGEEVPVYALDIPPELLDDVSDYYISFWYRHSQNIPEENARWADVFRKCFNVFRVRETETGDDSNLGDRSLQLLVCGGRDGKLYIRAVTYDVDSNNPNLAHDESILFSELEGTWIYVYAGYSKLKATMSAFVKIPRTDRTIFITVPAVHHETTEKLRLDVGFDEYITPLQSKYFDLNFHWGPDGEFLSSAEEIEALYEEAYGSEDNQPKEDIWGWTAAESPRTHNLSDDWEFNSKTQTENPHFSYQDEYDNAEEYAVYGWHRWNVLPDKSSWYLIYRLHSNQNPSNADQLGDRTLSLWIGDNVYHPATYHAADEKANPNSNVVQLFNYDQRDLNSWMFTYASYSRQA
jgi:hypothetical protein